MTLESPVSCVEYGIFLCLFSTLPVRGDYQNPWVNIQGEDSQGSYLIRKKYWTLRVVEWNFALRQWVLRDFTRVVHHSGQTMETKYTELLFMEEVLNPQRRKDSKIANVWMLNIPQNSYMKGSVPVWLLRTREPLTVEPGRKFKVTRGEPLKGIVGFTLTLHSSQVVNSFALPPHTSLSPEA